MRSKVSRALPACMVSVILSACGGGGGDTTPAATSYTVGGTVTGLGAGTQVTLLNNNSNSTAVSNGAFTFAATLSANGAYSVSVATQPTGQTCTVSNGSGSVATANISNVTVTCATTSSVASSSGAVGAFTSNGVTFALAPAAAGGATGSASLVRFPNTGNMIGAVTVTQISKTPIQTSLTKNGFPATVNGTALDPANDLGMAFNYNLSKISIFRLSTASEVSTYDSLVSRTGSYSGSSPITNGAVMDSARKSIILATADGFKIVDYSNPTAPVLKKSIPSLLADPVAGVEVMENFGYDNSLASGPLILTGGKESGPHALVLVNPVSGQVYRPDTATAALFTVSQYIDAVAVDTTYHVAVLADEGTGTIFVDLNKLTLNAANNTYTLPSSAVSRITTYSKMDNMGLESSSHLMMMGQGCGGSSIVVGKLLDPAIGLGFSQQVRFVMPRGNDSAGISYSFSGGCDPHTSGAYLDGNNVSRGLWVDSTGQHMAVIDLAKVLAGYSNAPNTYNPLTTTPNDIAYFAVP